MRPRRARSRQCRQLVAVASRVLKITEELLDENDRLEELLAQDRMTGLLHFGEFRERLEPELNRARRSGSPLALIFLDIDHLKPVNAVSYTRADGRIHSFVRILREATRNYHLVARRGGDEFFIAMPGTDADQATSIAERIRVITEVEGFTVSGGISAFPSPAVVTVEELLEQAEAALRRAKETRNTIVVAGR